MARKHSSALPAPATGPSVRDLRGNPLTDPGGLGPERLVGLGFRYWVLGRTTGDIGCWERAWSLYAGMFGVTRATIAVDALSGWVGALGKCSARSIRVAPADCRGFCRDECIAISMIAACQHQTCPAMRACAFALMESCAIDAVTARAQTFADTMSGLEQVLSPASIVTALPSITPANRLPS